MDMHLRLMASRLIAHTGRRNLRDWKWRRVRIAQDLHTKTKWTQRRRRAKKNVTRIERKLYTHTVIYGERSDRSVWVNNVEQRRFIYYECATNTIEDATAAAAECNSSGNWSSLRGGKNNRLSIKITNFLCKQIGDYAVLVVFMHSKLFDWLETIV